MSPRDADMGRMLAGAGVALGIALLPALRPTGPGNTGLADVGIVAAIVSVGLWAAAAHFLVRLPYTLGVWLLFIGGGVALVAQGAGLGPGLALTRDIFLLVWCAATAAVAGTQKGLRLILRTWAVSAVGWAILTLFGVLTGDHFLSGIKAADGIRLAGTLGDANLAASYFVASLFIVRVVVRRRVWRIASCSVLLATIIGTGSNGGFIGLSAATLFGAFISGVRRNGVAPAFAAASLAVVGVGMFFATVNIASLQAQTVKHGRILADSVGRTGSSQQSRSVILAETLGLYATGNPIGVGAGATKAVLIAHQAPYVKEAHDDFMASIVERGVLGGIGFIALITTIGMRLARVGSAPPDDIVRRPELLVAAVIAVLIGSAFYEVLHFRHLWALLGVVAALSLKREKR